MELKAIILAAGEGKRMKSQLPKVLHRVCGQTMLQHVVDAAEDAEVDECIVVVGHGAEEVKNSLKPHIKTVLQEVQLGTGHALGMTRELLSEDGLVLVLNGDGPLITGETLKNLLKTHVSEQYSATVLTTELMNPHGYGRIVRDHANQLKEIVEEKDTTLDEKKIKEINSGIYCFNSRELKEALPLLKNDNAQKEYYLTDVLSIMKGKGLSVGLYQVDDPQEIMAVNDRVQLAEVEAVMRRRINHGHMRNGVTIINPEVTYIEKGAQIGQDTIIYPGTSISRETTIGEGCKIGPDTQIRYSHIGQGVEINHSVVIESNIDDYSTLGPYAYLRPNSRVGKHVKIGDFVELKNASIGDYSKASHLAYIGDAEVGSKVNIGCGVVFVNYDGKNKHKTVVEDGAFVGSNANLIAPVVVKKNGYVASGSTITDEVPEGALAVARGRQENKHGWVEKKGLLKKDK